MLHRLFNLLCIFTLAFVAFTVIGVHQASAEEALASWYGPGFEGQTTASGEPYDPSGYTVASKTIPLGTELIVSYGGQSVPVTVNDRGPYVGSRDLDLSQAAAQTLGLDQAGVDYVDYTYADSGYTAPEPTYTEPTYTEPAAPEPAYTDSVATPATGASADQATYVEPSTPDTSGAYEAAPVQQSQTGAYVVQSGDTLSEVAMQLGTTTDSLASQNGISNPDYIQSGQTIYY